MTFFKRIRITLLIGFFIFGVKPVLSQTFEFNTSELPRYRNGKDILVAPNASVIMVGGWLRNDSISGIYRSTDTCKTWNIVKDQLGGMLSCIVQIHANKLLTLGRSGTIGFSTDNGTTWNLSRLNNHSNTEFTAASFPNSKKGIVIGWNETNKKTIVLKTENEAESFQTVVDSNWGKPMYLLHSDSLKLWIITQTGILLHSQNGGNNWESLTLSSSSKLSFYSMAWITKEQFFISGQEINNSDTQQTIWIYNHTNHNFTKRYSEKGSYFSQIRFLSGEAYILSKSHLYYSKDTCKTLLNIQLPNQNSDNRTLNNLSLIHPGSGIICGNQGRTITFYNSSYQIPTVQISEIKVTKKREIKIINYIQPKGLNPSCYLIYEGMNSKKDSIFLGKLTGFEPVLINSYLNLVSGVYQFQLIAYYKDVSVRSEKIQLDLRFDNYTNFDFEFWDTTETKTLENWGTVGNVKSILNNQWIEIKSNHLNEPGGVFLANVQNDSIRGGIPLQQKIDTVYLKCRYKIAKSDSAYLSLRFKNTAQKEFKQIDYRWSGMVHQDTILKFPTRLNSSSYDSLILIVLSTDYFNNRTDTSSILWLDSVWTNNSSNPLPNPGFSNWNIQNSFELKNWGSRNYLDLSETIVEPTRGYHSKSTGVKFELHSSRSMGSLMYGQLLNDSNTHFPRKTKITSNHRSLHGYFQFFPQSIYDTLFIESYIFKDTQIIGFSRNTIVNASDSWSSFNFPIEYYNTQNLATDASISIYLKSEINTNSGKRAFAILDDFSFDFALDSNFSASNQLLKSHNSIGLLAYPNPTNGLLNIHFNHPINLKSCSIYSLQGKKLLDISTANILSIEANNSFTPIMHNSKSVNEMNYTIDQFQIDCSNLTSGIYIAEIIHSKGRNTVKFQVKN